MAVRPADEVGRGLKLKSNKTFFYL